MPTAQPDYDVIAINMPWLGDFAERGDLAPLDDLIANAAINPLDFHPSVWGTGNWKGTQFGIPLYCTIEILAARKDKFEENNLAFPKTFDETISVARALHDPAREFYGIAWNGQRGMPIANSFMFFLAACRKNRHRHAVAQSRELDVRCLRETETSDRHG